MHRIGSLVFPECAPHEQHVVWIIFRQQDRLKFDMVNLGYL